MSFLFITAAVFAFILYMISCKYFMLSKIIQKMKRYAFAEIINQDFNGTFKFVSEYFNGFKIMEFLLVNNMEDNSHHGIYQTYHCINQIIDGLLDITFAIVKSNRINQIIEKQMPKDYLNYIGDVSILLHSHRNPINQKVLLKTITEPTESNSYQLHNPNPLRRIHKTVKIEEDADSLNKKGETRKQSICISHRSRGSRLPTRKFMSKRKILDNSKLIPLNRASENHDYNEVYQDKITQLRKRKIKLQQAMKAFKEEDKPDKFFQSKKTKENHLHFTTDFKGKIIVFNPNQTKLKKPQSNQPIIKFETLVQSSRSWTNWGKVSSNTRRNLFLRQGTHISQCDMN